MKNTPSLIAELENSLKSGPNSERSRVLRQIADLFLKSADTYLDKQVSVFDDVTIRLIDQIERQALIELSKIWAPASKAPINTVHHLSRHDDIAVSGPILEQSTILSDDFLVQIAQTKGDAQRAAIAGRAHLGEALTDVLVDRGNLEVSRKVTSNAGARFSTHGFTTLANRAANDAQLAISFANRKDIPPDIFDKLLQRATDVVKQKLLANAPPTMKDRISQTVDLVSQQVARMATLRPAGGGGRTVMQNAEHLKVRLVKFAQAGQSSETIETLATLCGVSAISVKNVVRQGSDDGVLILGKAVGLGWPELQQVLLAVLPRSIENRAAAKTLFDKYLNLSSENARRALKIIKMSKDVSRKDIARMISAR